MGGSALTAVQQSIYGVLSVDAPLLAALAGAAPPGDPKIYDRPPKNLPRYILLGDADEMKLDTMRRSGKTVRPRILAVTRDYNGFLEVEGLIDRVITLLDDEDLVVEGFDFIHAMHDATRVGRYDDGTTVARWAMAEFSIQVMKQVSP